MYLLIFVIAALYGGWKAKNLLQLLLASGAVSIINFVFALEKLETYRRQAELGNSTAETAFLVLVMLVFTLIFFFVAALIPFVTKKILYRRRSLAESGPV